MCQTVHDYLPTDDLSGKIQKTLQWDSLQHCRAVADLCVFYELRNNLANIAIPPNLVRSVKHNCHYNHFQYLNSDALNYQILSEVSDFGISFLTIWQLNHLLSHFALQPSSGPLPNSGTIILSQIHGAWFKILPFCAAVICCLKCYHLLL